MILLARIVRIALTVLVLLIVAGIVLHLLHASGSNCIVSAVYDAGAWLVSPFANVFHPQERRRGLICQLGAGRARLRDRWWPDSPGCSPAPAAPAVALGRVGAAA